jgi:hypothetical protein
MLNQQDCDGGEYEPKSLGGEGREDQQGEHRQHRAGLTKHAADRESRIVDGLTAR